MRPSHLSLPPDVERLLAFVSPRVGIVTDLMAIPRSVDEPVPPVLYQATLSHFDFKKAKPLDRAAAGKGLTEAEAIAGAIGEAIERYCASHVDQQRVRRATPAALAAEAGAGAGAAPVSYIAPEECVLYAPSQHARRDFAYRKPGPKVEIGWIDGHELPAPGDGPRDVLVPAALVYLFGGSAEDRDVFCPATSNGLAAGPTLAAAVQGGLCELIERDAFLVTWMNRLPAPEVDLIGLGGAARSIHDHYARFGLETRVFDVTTNVPVPAMMAISIDRTGESPAAVVGLGCHLDARVAVLKALFEVCQVRPGETRRMEEARAAGKQLVGYRDVRTLEDHSAFFAPRERLDELSFLLKPHRPRPLLERPAAAAAAAAPADEALAATVEALTQVGCRVAYVDLTTPDVADSGVRVVRAIATGLQPIHFGFGEERLGGRRLFDVPRLMGYTASTRTEVDLNPCPHPLA